MAKKNFNFITVWTETERIYGVFEKNASCTECGKLALSAPQPSATGQACKDFAGNGPNNYDRSSI